MSSAGHQQTLWIERLELCKAALTLATPPAGTAQAARGDGLKSRMRTGHPLAQKYCPSVVQAQLWLGWLRREEVATSPSLEGQKRCVTLSSTKSSTPVASQGEPNEGSAGKAPCMDGQMGSPVLEKEVHPGAVLPRCCLPEGTPVCWKEHGNHKDDWRLPDRQR